MENTLKSGVNYRLFGKNHKAVVVACVRVIDDPDFPRPCWLWTLRFVTPIKMYDGSMMHQTFVRRFHAAATGLAVAA